MKGLLGPGGFAYAAAGLAIVGSWLTERAPARVR
jgi:hypothetical protein